MKNLIKKWLDIKTKDVQCTTIRPYSDCSTQQDLNKYYNEYAEHIQQLTGAINGMQSQIDKKANALQSQFDSKLSNLENRLKNEGVDDQIDLLENLTKFLLDESGYRLYQLKEERETYLDYLIPIGTFTTVSKRTWEDEPMCQHIDIDDLKKLKDYTTITIGKEKYFLSKTKLK